MIVMSIIALMFGIVSFFSDMWYLSNYSVNSNESDTNKSSIKNKILVEDVIVDGSRCVNSNCFVSIEKANSNTDYVLDVDNSDLVLRLGDYEDYIKLNIYYVKKDKRKIIVDYKMFLKSSNEDISNIKTEDELRKKIGLYPSGTYTELLTLSEIGTTGIVFKTDQSFTYTNYTFIDSKNNEYEMKYINLNDVLSLTEGNKYNVTFEVVKDTHGYEFNIKSVQ